MSAGSKSDLPTSLDIDTRLLLRELWNGHWVATAVADSSLVSYGTEAGVVDDHESGLAKYLVTVRPPVLARFGLPEGVELRVVEVELHRPDVPERLAVGFPISVPAVLVPAKRDWWVIVPLIDHTFYVGRNEDLNERIRAEVTRMVGAHDMVGESFLRLFPSQEVELRSISVEIEHGGGGVTGRASALRKKQADDYRRNKALEVMAEIGSPVHERVAGATLPALVGRARTLRSLGALLSGTERASVALVGEESAGKTAVFERWLAGSDRRVYSTSGAQLIAGMSGFGEWQQRVVDVMNAAEQLDAILYFDNLAELFGERPERGGVDIAGVMRRYVLEGRVRVVGEITPDALEHASTRQVALFGAINRVRVEPLSAKQTVEALASRVRHWARHEAERPQIDPEVVRPVVDLAERYTPYRAFPGKAVRFVDELRATRDGERDGMGKPPTIGVQSVYEAFSLTTGIPAFLLREDRALLVESVIDTFGKRIVGQAQAVRRVVETICVVKAQLQPAGKPLATFLFVGPTGTGKTELARTLSQFLFGSIDRMVRFDMSEYTDPRAAERLIRGTERDEGLLTGKVREQPFCVLLLDEIEKAHPAVFDLLLQVCGEGRLSDARGKTTFFHNAIIIMTSNLGAAHRRAPIGLASTAVSDDEQYLRAVRTTFRPEFLNRLDRIIAFATLTREEVERVASIAVARIAERRGVQEAGIALELSGGALSAVAAGGYSDTYGVRALRRHLDDYVATPVSRLLARLGNDAKGGAIWVSAASEQAGAPEHAVKQRITTIESGDLRFELYRRPSAAGKRALRGVASVAYIRRRVDALMDLERVQNVADRVGWLRSQLATAAHDQTHRKKKRRERAAQIMRDLQTEHHRLTKVWDRAVGLSTDIHDAEELALSALFEGEEAKEWNDDVNAMFCEFRRALFYVFVSHLEHRNEITLIASELGESAGFRHWLAPLVEAMPGRGWTGTYHVRGSEARRDWPAERTWTPPRDATWLERKVLDNPGQHKSVLMRITGRDVGPLLAHEVGIHRFVGFASGAPRHMSVRMVAMRTDLADREWFDAAITRAPHPPPPVKQRVARQRTRGTDNVAVFGRLAGVPLADYWNRFEEVALEHFLHLLENDDTDLLFNAPLPWVKPKAKP